MMEDYTLRAVHSRKQDRQPTGSPFSYGLRIHCVLKLTDPQLAHIVSRFLKKDCPSFKVGQRTLQVDDFAEDPGKWSFYIYTRLSGLRPQKRANLEREVRATVSAFVAYMEAKLGVKNTRPAFTLTIR